MLLLSVANPGPEVRSCSYTTTLRYFIIIIIIRALLCSVAKRLFHIPPGSVVRRSTASRPQHPPLLAI